MKKRLQKGIELGSVIVEALLLTSIMIAITPLLYRKIKERDTNLEHTAVSQELDYISRALNNYIIANQDDLASKPHKTNLDFSDLANYGLQNYKGDKNFFIKNFSIKLIHKQGLDQKKYVEAVLIANSENMDDDTIPKIARNLGNSAGYTDRTGKIIPITTAWNPEAEDFASLDVPAKSIIVRTNPIAYPNFVSRTHPREAEMLYDLDMDGFNIMNAGTITTRNINVVSAPLTLSTEVANNSTGFVDVAGDFTTSFGATFNNLEVTGILTLAKGNVDASTSTISAINANVKGGTGAKDIHTVDLTTPNNLIMSGVNPKIDVQKNLNLDSYEENIKAEGNLEVISSINAKTLKMAPNDYDFASGVIIGNTFELDGRNLTPSETMHLKDINISGGTEADRFQDVFQTKSISEAVIKTYSKLHDLDYKESVGGLGEAGTDILSESEALENLGLTSADKLLLTVQNKHFSLTDASAKNLCRTRVKEGTYKTSSGQVVNSYTLLSPEDKELLRNQLVYRDYRQRMYNCYQQIAQYYAHRSTPFITTNEVSKDRTSNYRDCLYHHRNDINVDSSHLVVYNVWNEYGLTKTQDQVSSAYKHYYAYPIKKNGKWDCATVSAADAETYKGNPALNAVRAACWENCLPLVWNPNRQMYVCADTQPRPDKTVMCSAFANDLQYQKPCHHPVCYNPGGLIKPTATPTVWECRENVVPSHVEKTCSDASDPEIKCKAITCSSGYDCKGNMVERWKCRPKPSPTCETCYEATCDDAIGEYICKENASYEKELATCANMDCALDEDGNCKTNPTAEEKKRICTESNKDKCCKEMTCNEATGNWQCLPVTNPDYGDIKADVKLGSSDKKLTASSCPGCFASVCVSAGNLRSMDKRISTSVKNDLTHEYTWVCAANTISGIVQSFSNTCDTQTLCVINLNDLKQNITSDGVSDAPWNVAAEANWGGIGNLGYRMCDYISADNPNLLTPINFNTGSDEAVDNKEYMAKALRSLCVWRNYKAPSKSPCLKGMSDDCLLKQELKNSLCLLNNGSLLTVNSTTGTSPYCRSCHENPTAECVEKCFMHGQLIPSVGSCDITNFLKPTRECQQCYTGSSCVASEENFPNTRAYTCKALSSLSYNGTTTSTIGLYKEACAEDETPDLIISGKPTCYTDCADGEELICRNNNGQCSCQCDVPTSLKCGPCESPVLNPTGGYSCMMPTYTEEINGEVVDGCCGKLVCEGGKMVCKYHPTSLERIKNGCKATEFPCKEMACIESNSAEYAAYDGKVYSCIDKPTATSCDPENSYMSCNSVNNEWTCSRLGSNTTAPAGMKCDCGDPACVPIYEGPVDSAVHFYTWACQPRPIKSADGTVVCASRTSTAATADSSLYTFNYTNSKCVSSASCTTLVCQNNKWTWVADANGTYCPSTGSSCQNEFTEYDSKGIFRVNSTLTFKEQYHYAAPANWGLITSYIPSEPGTNALSHTVNGIKISSLPKKKYMCNPRTVYYGRAYADLYVIFVNIFKTVGIGCRARGWGWHSKQMKPGTTGIQCNNGFFGDPYGGEVKMCTLNLPTYIGNGGYWPAYSYTTSYSCGSNGDDTCYDTHYVSQHPYYNYCEQWRTHSWPGAAIMAWEGGTFNIPQ